MLDVPDVAANAALHLVEGLGLTAVAGDLAPAGDAWLDVVADHVFVDQVGVLLGVLEHVGAGTHDAHLPEQHVDELRELVDAGLAQYLAPLGHAGVVPRGLQTVGLGVDLHATELQAGELPAVDSGALLAEKDGPGHGEFGDYRHHDKHGNKQCAEEEQRERYVERPLDGAVARPAERLLVEAQAGHAAHHREVHLVADVVAHVGHAVEPDQMVLAVFDYGQDHLGLLRGQTAVEAADLVGMLLQIILHLLGPAEIGAVRGKAFVGLEIEVAADPEAQGGVVGELVVERGVVLGASHEHHSVAPPGVHPELLHEQPHEQPEAQYHHEHRDYAERVDARARPQEVGELEYRGGDDGEPEDVVEHDLHYLRLLGLLDVQHHSAVGYAGVVHRRNHQQRLPHRGTSVRPAEIHRQKEDQIAEQQVAQHHHKPDPRVVAASVVRYFHVSSFFQELRIIKLPYDSLWMILKINYILTNNNRPLLSPNLLDDPLHVATPRTHYKSPYYPTFSL